MLGLAQHKLGRVEERVEKQGRKLAALEVREGDHVRLGRVDGVQQLAHGVAHGQGFHRDGLQPRLLLQVKELQLVERQLAVAVAVQAAKPVLNRSGRRFVLFREQEPDKVFEHELLFLGTGRERRAATQRAGVVVQPTRSERDPVHNASGQRVLVVLRQLLAVVAAKR